ncbi:MAG: segregation and condensation protein A [Planctomycetaceae bacterium]
MMLAEYRIETAWFGGPLDLLLHLVRRHEVDVCEISLARIATDFDGYFGTLAHPDFDLASDFAVVASTLLEIKSQEVLPRDQPAETNEQPDAAEDSSDLIARLMQYRRYRDAAAQLEQRGEEWLERYPRLSRHRPVAGRDHAEDRIREVELWDLVSALTRIVRIPDVQQTIAIRMDETPMAVFQEQIRDRLITEERVAFSSFFSGEKIQARIVGIFLAILELIRHEGYRALQPVDYDEIWILAPLADASPLANPPSSHSAAQAASASVLSRQGGTR